MSQPIDKRKCPCCTPKSPKPQKMRRPRSITPEPESIKTVRVKAPKGRHCSPYAFLGCGEIWANRSFIKSLCKKKSSSKPSRKQPCAEQTMCCQIHCKADPCSEQTRCCKVPCKPDPCAEQTMCCQIHCKPDPCSGQTRCCKVTCKPDPCVGQTMCCQMPCESENTYRVCEIKSKNDLCSGDLLIETANKKYLKVLGPEDCSEDGESYIMINCGNAMNNQSDYDDCCALDDEVCAAYSCLAMKCNDVCCPVEAEYSCEPERYLCKKKTAKTPEYYKCVQMC